MAAAAASGRKRSERRAADAPPLSPVGPAHGGGPAIATQAPRSGKPAQRIRPRDVQPQPGTPYRGRPCRLRRRVRRLLQVARTALLQQTFALTGDLPASRSAVRDAFVAAWHHWRKVSRLEDPEAWVRPLAWRHAQRRHSARIFHRDRKLDPEIRATLDALAKLPLAQRKVLLLTQLTDASMADMAREVGLPLHEAEQRLQTATSQFAMNREVLDDGHPPAVRAPARARVRRSLATGHHHPPRGHRPAPYPHGRGRGRRRRGAGARRRRRHRRPGREAVARERPQHRRRSTAPRSGGRRPG